MRFLSIDVAFASSGLVVFDVKDNKLVPVYVGTILSAPAKKNKKRFTYVAEEDVYRCQILAQGILDTISTYKVDAVVMEIPNGGAKGARAARCLGMATGVLAALELTQSIPFVVSFPDDWHQTVMGRTKKITKEEVKAWVRAKWPEFPWPINEGEHEHVADAAGVAYHFQGHQIYKTFLAAKGTL